MEKFMNVLTKERFVIIYRGLTPDKCVGITEVLLKAGVRHFEVTMNTPDAIHSIQALIQRFGDKAYIGGGTVLKSEEVKAIHDVGGQFIISPNTKTDVIHTTKKLGMYFIPGAFTPTEIVSSWDAGADMVKVFPINIVGAEHIKQIRGPFERIPFMATGGVSLGMVEDLFDAGVHSIGLGVHLLGQELLRNKNWDAVVAKMAEFQKAAAVSDTEEL